MATSVNVIASSVAAVTVAAGILWFMRSKRRRVHLSEWTPLRLIEKQVVNHNCNLYRFALPHPDAMLHLPLGRHLQVRVASGESYAVRSYTPTSLPTELGHFDLIIKTYAQGKVSSHMASLQIGDSVEFKGPRGDYEHQVDKVYGMIAGGTGITPMLQVIRGILANPNDHSLVNLIFANVTEADIILREELEALPKDRVKVYHVLNEPPAHGWMGGQGFVSQEHIEQHFKGVDRVLLCGPPPMVKGMQGLLANLGYSPSQIYKF